jgi:hypothetical protein
MMYFILIIILVLLIMYSYGNFYQINCEHYDNADSCNLNIDELKITKRNKTYENLIDKLIDDKSVLFTNDQIKIMKNNNQFYNVNKNDDVSNISQKVYLDCKQNFDSNLNDNKKRVMKKYPNTEYDNITNQLDNNIVNSSSYKGNKIKVLENDNYLKNYYLDIFGNRVESNLEDYFANYYLTINDKYGEEPKEAIKVNTIEGNDNFIIPNQYNNNKHMTNAYNVDWSRIINPKTQY